MNDVALDLDAVPASAAVAVVHPALATALAVAGVVVLLALIAGSAAWALRAAPGNTVKWPALHQLPPAARLLVVLMVFALLVVQGLAALDVYVQTRVNQSTVSEYFYYLTAARLLGMSHSHVFGYAFTYGLLAAVATLTPLGERARCLLVAGLLWAGLFDVLSWWGIKYVGAPLELLAVTSGSITAVGSLVALGAMVASLAPARSTAP